MADIFISYARVDREWVKMLAGSFARKGYSVWWDHDIPPGVTFDDFISNQLALAKSIIVVWSKASIISRWVRAEAFEGITRNNLVPVLMQNVNVPLAFRNIQAADLTDWTGQENHEAFQSVYKRIETLVDKESIEIAEENQRYDNSINQLPDNAREIQVHLKVNKVFNDELGRYQLMIDDQEVWQSSLTSQDGMIYTGQHRQGTHIISFRTDNAGGFTISKMMDLDSNKRIDIRVKKSWWDGKQQIEIR